MRRLLPLTIGPVVALVITGCAPPNGQGGDAASEAIASPQAAADLQTTSQSSAGFFSEIKSFRGWTAVCDNVNSCAAYGPATDHMGYVLVTIGAGPAARPEVRAGSWNLASDASSVQLSIDGTHYAEKNGEGATGQVLLIDPASDQLLSALAQGRSLNISDGADSVSVPLSGAAAALLWIDERQGRLGTTTALMRKGTKPANSVPAAITPPRIIAAPPVAQTNLPKALPATISSLPRVQQCENESRDFPITGETWSVNRLSRDTLIWSIPCGSGAYNLSHIYLTSAADGTAPALARFPTSERTEDSLINSHYDSATNSVSAFAKGRGLGDCGQSALWLWSGAAFVLAEEKTMGECVGLEPELWPSTWRTTH